MSNLDNFSPLSNTLAKKRILLLIQFFLIIFVYHTLKDMKDSVVITASEAGAEVIPFIKIWAMLPASIGASVLFAKLYHRFGRERTAYVLLTILLSAYALFAFCFYPFRDALHLSGLQNYLTLILPAGCKGFVAMVSFWHYTLFYITAELWSPMILSILFWGYVNEVSTLEDAKKFYPLCAFTGNFAGILSGVSSHWLCNNLRHCFSWQQTMQLMIGAVILCGGTIILINRLLSSSDAAANNRFHKKKTSAGSFWDNIQSIFQSPPLLCIAALVVAFGLTGNLIEVVWKQSVRQLYPDPQAYNAYINQLTSLIGMLAVGMALISRWLFKHISWSKTALITPVALFITSSIFFTALMIPSHWLSSLASAALISPLALVVLLGSAHYVLAMTAKYTLFDTCKEMAFLSVKADERIKAKSIIDSVGSRLGKSGGSCLFQFLLVFFGSTAGHVSIIGITSVVFIGISIVATKKLGKRLSTQSELEESLASSS